MTEVYLKAVLDDAGESIRYYVITTIIGRAVLSVPGDYKGRAAPPTWWHTFRVGQRLTEEEAVLIGQHNRTEVSSKAYSREWQLEQLNKAQAETIRSLRQEINDLELKLSQIESLAKVRFTGDPLRIVRHKIESI